jgi:hypothetical protein
MCQTTILSGTDTTRDKSDRRDARTIAWSLMKTASMIELSWVGGFLGRSDLVDNFDHEHMIGTTRTDVVENDSCRGEDFLAITLAADHRSNFLVLCGFDLRQQLTKQNLMCKYFQANKLRCFFALWHRLMTTYRTSSRSFFRVYSLRIGDLRTTMLSFINICHDRRIDETDTVFFACRQSPTTTRQLLQQD